LDATAIACMCGFFDQSIGRQLVWRRHLQPAFCARLRFAMVDDGLGSKLVPWTPSI
jgi:hypothetical protein